MSRTSARVRAAVLCSALAVSITACASAEPDPAAPVSGPDLFAALPSAVPSPTPTFDVVPPTSTQAAPTTTSKPPRTTTTTRPRTEGAGGGGAAAAPAAPQLPWRQVAGDEFNTDTLDTTVWTPYDSIGGFGNGLRRPDAISVSDGTLKITSRGEISGGMAQKFGQTYGRWEFRARSQPGRGLGSVVLLWPDSENWPEDGEINIMEIPGENRDLAHFILHWGAENNTIGTALAGDFTQWYTFAVEWLPDRVTWYVNGVKQYENTDPVVIPKNSMHLTVQLDQGPVKDWMPPRDETTPPEVAMEVDWVRVYAL